MFQNNNKFFKIDWNPFAVTLLQPLSVTTDPYTLKREIKKALVEIRDTVNDPLILTWSGGFDSAFAVLCYLELINEKKLTSNCYSLAGARFTDGKISSNKDYRRGELFLKHINISSYGVNVNLQGVLVDRDFILKCATAMMDYKFASFAFAAQQVWRDDQDGCVIFHMGGQAIRLNTGSSETINKDNQGICLFHPYQFSDFKEKSNNINVYTWNAEIFNSFITPYALIAPTVEYNKDWHTSEYDAWVIESHMARNITMLTCFPELVLLYPKIGTIGFKQFLLDKKDEKTKNYWYDTMKVVNKFVGQTSPHVFLKLPNGDPVTSIDQTQKFFSQR